MKYTTLYRTSLALGLSFLAPIMDAQWLQHSTAVAGVSTTAVFPGASGAYTGIVTATASNLVDGGTNGVPGITPTAFTNVTPTFLANFALNPGNTFDYLNVGYNDPGDHFDVTISFAGLALGYLPAGSVMAFLDIDISENVRSLTAFGTAGGLATPWLSALASSPFDYDNAAGDGISSALTANISQSGGVYNFLGQDSNQSSAFQGFTTTQNIASITWHFDRIGGGAGPGGYAVAIGQAVPEPSTTAFAVTAALAGLVVFKRTSVRDALRAMSVPRTES